MTDTTNADSEQAKPLGLASTDLLGARREVPRYRHDCRLCTFLGGVQRELYADLYHCMQGGASPTVVARFSDECHDYLSGIPLAGMCDYLGDAVERAEELCLPVGA